MKRAKVFISIVFLLGLMSPALKAETTRYGGLYHFSDTPRAIFLLGKIEQNDSFELRRAMRNHDIDLVVLGSPGGNLYEGLQIASIIHDNNLNTYVPGGWNCESSCATVFLGGNARMLIGDLGVHQFYTPDQDQKNANLGTATKDTLYTTSEIIGIMNEFETPPFVYEKMFGTTDIYYFSGSEKLRLSRNIDDAAFLGAIAEVDPFIERKRSELLELRNIHRYEIASSTAPLPQPKPETKAPSNGTSNFPNVDFFGGDLTQQGYRNVSMSQCDAICRSNPSCAAWSYVISTNWCWPKSRVTNMSISDDVISSIIDYSRIDQTIFDRPFLEATGIDIRGYDIFPQGLRNTSLDQCRSICERNDSCLGFSWVANKNWCFPKYDIGEFDNRIGVISGVWAPK
ncbi:PAN domain-containing protein [Marivivens sp. LCG002]|uniref:PAN domain-containing protein n=1 Tax=Marivivens sp. LCG002 TaxID=3051171 RepID=UPI0025553C50|nr:PAN domain-containing protein [Marivivens sp. LCG002]WIV52057.1 PAN domain-containing protein [Marivivens sp. LCG002]